MLELSFFPRCTKWSVLFPGPALSAVFCFQAKKLLGTDEKQLGVRERLMAGSMAGVASQTSIYPMEVRQGGVTKHPTVESGTILLGDTPGYQTKHP